MAKTRLYEFDKSATWTLHRIVRDILTIFSPICPFFTHYISMEIYSISSISIQEYPMLNLSDDDSDYAKVGPITNSLTEFNSLIWKTKKENNLSLKSALSNIKIPLELMILQDPLTKMHNLE